MKHEDETPWLRERMQALRERRNATVPAFEQVWRAARAQSAPAGEPVAWSSWKLAGAPIAAILAVAVGIFWTASQREHSRRIERDFATVDGALLTYWQAPSDDLLPAGNWNDSPKP